MRARRSFFSAVFPAAWRGILLLAGLAGAVVPAARAGFEKAPEGIKFTYRDAGAGQVAVAGEWNGWSASASPLAKDASGVWSVVVSLGPGEHQYKFVVDGEWLVDPENPMTGGDYGNSVVRIGADGNVVMAAAASTSNTPLSGKVFLDSRYIALFQGRRDETVEPEWDFTRPGFDLDLDFKIQVNEQLRAHVLTNINNGNQNVQLWETNLVFDRGNMSFLSDDLNFMVFDNDSVGSWDDPLHLVGNIGIYGHPWGFNQQGILAWRQVGPVEARLLYSDNFRTGGTSAPSADAVFNSQIDNLTGTPGSVVRGYLVSESDNNKDVLALRLKAPALAPGLLVGASYRNDRGANPGAYAEMRELAGTGGARTITAARYAGTIENWQGGGIDARYEDEEAGFEVYGDVLLGEAHVAGHGDSLRVTLTPRAPTSDNPDTFLVESAVTGGAEPLHARLDRSLRTLIGGHYYSFRGWHGTGSVEFQDHDLVSGPNFTDARYNRLATYRLGLRFNGEEWKEWPWEAALDLEFYDFQYGSETWEDQLWFDAHNFWLEQGEHVVTLDRLVMLGGHDVISWKPRVRWMFYAPRHATVNYRGVVNATGLDKKPKYLEQIVRFHVDLFSRLGLNTDTRFVRYNDPVLNLQESFLSHFLELKYQFSPMVEVGLSWGVDPWVIDAPANEYAYIGRDQFLFARGANGGAARTTFLDLGDVIAKAEQALEDEKRLQVEAIVKF